MRQSFLKFGALALVAMGFVACSDESRLGIQKPLIVTKFDNGNFYYVFQSQDENTIIEDYVVNRGNCGEGLKQYKYDGDLAKQHQKELCSKYKDKICYNETGGIIALLDKQGNIQYVTQSFCERSLIKNKRFCEISLSTYNNLNDDFKKLYKKIEPIRLGYGRTMRLDIGKCRADEVIEAQLVLNGGKKITYNVSVATGGY